MSTPVPEVMRIGQARLTAGLDRFASIGLREHEEIFGSLRRVATAQLIDLAESNAGEYDGWGTPVLR